MTLGHRVAVFNAGRLQQVAPPRELYERPANTFVAGFIGQPPMNLIPAHGLPSPLAGEGPGERGTCVTLGIRPETLRLAQANETGLPATVDMAEFLGHETLLHAHLEGMGTPIIVRMAGLHDFPHGAPLTLAVEGPPHLFDAAGLALN
jgi:ABC-type sugar transport system ATPase subunit